MNLGLEVTRLETQDIGSDEARNLRSREQHASMKTEMTYQGYKMGQSENTGLICQ